MKETKGIRSKDCLVTEQSAMAVFDGMGEEKAAARLSLLHSEEEFENL